MKILLGGTFDPVHVGHIALARHVSDHLQAKVSLMPLNGVPDYKKAPQATLSQRLDMLQMVCNKYPRQIDLELSETHLTEYSPSYFTLKRLRAAMPNNEVIFFIVGGDSFLSIDSWHHWQELFTLSNFIVAMRPEYDLWQMSPELNAVVQPLIVNRADYSKPYGQVVFTNFPPIEISSTAIRQACHNNDKFAQWLEPEIYQYIIQHKLYKGI